ncbi:MAG: hypothetical protein K2I45_03290, partial [Muribaculaceae bacterium]|nr:hypothetical protein [Muribaculaceae bacterium]
MKSCKSLLCVCALLTVLPAVAGDSIPSPQAAPAGKYIFVPDSLQDDVIRLLDGHSKVVDDLNRLDPDEMTVFKGDTVPMVLRSINLGRYDRGLSTF